MSKNTFSPWAIRWNVAQGGEAHQIVDGRDLGELSVIATVHFHDDDHDGETIANARLLAAAPELRDALPHPSRLRTLARVFEMVDDAAQRDGVVVNSDEVQRDLRRWADAIEAVLGKIAS